MRTPPQLASRGFASSTKIGAAGTPRSPGMYPDTAPQPLHQNGALLNGAHHALKCDDYRDDRSRASPKWGMSSGSHLNVGRVRHGASARRGSQIGGRALSLTRDTRAPGRRRPARPLLHRARARTEGARRDRPGQLRCLESDPGTGIAPTSSEERGGGGASRAGWPRGHGEPAFRIRDVAASGVPGTAAYESHTQEKAPPLSSRASAVTKL